MDDDIPYLLLTPGPLTTSRSVRQAMQRDYCTWDKDYNTIVEGIRQSLVHLATRTNKFTSVLMQGSGTFAVEAAIGSLIPAEGKILIFNNGAYGARMVQIAQRLRIATIEIKHDETEPPDIGKIVEKLDRDPTITHVAMVHCETTTGMLNPVQEIGREVHHRGKIFLVDAMSSFGGIPFTMENLGADVLISSANKCIQGVPGFAFVLADRTLLEKSKGWARSLSLDLHDQWKTMEEQGGKWRYTSPTHVVRAFAQALEELDREGGIEARHRRYQQNQRTLVQRLSELGFQTLLPLQYQSPIITAFLYPNSAFSFDDFYQALKARRYVIYPGKVSQAATFRIGNIGHVFLEDIMDLTHQIAEVIKDLNISFEKP